MRPLWSFQRTYHVTFSRLVHSNTVQKLHFCQIKMGSSNNKPLNVSAESAEAQKSDKPLKPCCACPETKKIRDDCIMTKGEENCVHLIEAHKACMRSLGFNI